MASRTQICSLAKTPPKLNEPITFPLLWELLRYLTSVRHVIYFNDPDFLTFICILEGAKEFGRYSNILSGGSLLVVKY